MNGPLFDASAVASLVTPLLVIPALGAAVRVFIGLSR